MKIINPTMLLLLAITLMSAMAHAEKERRIEFGDAYIKGQSLKANAAYLLNRRKAQTASLIKVRRDYRTEILQDFVVIDNFKTKQMKKENVSALSPVQ